MYKIKHNQNQNTLEVENSKKNIYGKIMLDDGASLQKLTLNGHAIIQDLTPLTYDSTYASSILFPFVNRIKGGAYTYEGKAYKFEANQEEENNALHGLVFDKTFMILKQTTNEDKATIVLEYIENKESKGFPYTYSIQLKYTFFDDKLSLDIKVKNTDSKPFPFTIGWHPYFISENLQKSTLDFYSEEKLIIGDRNITTGIETITQIKTFHIKDKQLDDCWILKANQIHFNTPKYQLVLDSTAENNFLQAYTPPKANAIAIEPTTGVSDSFNNKIGLQTLNANAVYEITWNLKIKNN